MKRLEQQLTALKKPSMDSPLHRAQLRRVLLNSSRTRFGSFTFLTMSFYKLLPASLAVVLVFGLAFAFHSGQTSDYVRYVAPDASAEELVSSAIEHLQTLTPEELTQLATQNGFTVDGIFTDLQNAIAADDLSLAELTPLSCDDLGEEGVVRGFSFGEDVVENEDGTFASDPCYTFQVHFGPDRSSATGYSEVYTFNGPQSVAEAKGLTPIEYTTPEGDRVGLFITEDLFPIMGIYYDPSVDTTMTFQGPGDFSQNNDAEISTVDGSTGCTSWQSDDGLMGGGGC